jgi:hypothetical protein
VGTLPVADVPDAVIIVKIGFFAVFRLSNYGKPLLIIFLKNKGSCKILVLF